MPSITLDRLASAAGLHAQTNALLDAHGDELRELAVTRQRDISVPLAQLLGLLIDADDELVIGVAVAEEVMGTLLGDVPEDQRDRLREFIARPVPPTHLRVVVWDDHGVALLRLDTVPVRTAGQA